LTTVLILADDLGFVFWLGHVLDAAEYSAWPAKAVADAALLILQLHLRIDVLVVDLALAGALDFIAALRRSQGHCKVVGVLNEAVVVTNIPGVAAVHTKPPVRNEVAMMDWLQCIQGVVATARHATTSN
jgi:hypothetical protein